MQQIDILTQINSSPKSPGVYYFYNKNNLLLYVGKSISIRDRIRSHYSNAKYCQKEKRLISETTKITWQLTTGELGALLLEAQHIKNKQPIYNRLLKKRRTLYGIQLLKNSSTYHQAELIRLTDIKITQTDSIYGLSRNKKKLSDTLIQYVKKANLCAKLMGIEKTNGPCFYYQLKYCKGACINLEAPEEYNARQLKTLEQIGIKNWNFPSAIIIQEKSIKGKKATYHLINKWCHIISSHNLKQLKNHLITEPILFDFDIYKILVKSILLPHPCIEIIS